MPTVPIHDPDGSLLSATLPDRARRASPMAPEDRRSAILAAAIPLLRTRGTAVTTRELADAAGVAEGTLFRVFVDKDALIHAAIEQALDPDPVINQLAAIDAGTGLRTALTEAVAILQARSGEVAMLLSMSHELSSGRSPHGPHGSHGPHAHPPGHHPMDLVMQAVAALLVPHADLLRLEPVACARILVGLVMASTLPLAVRTAPALTPEQIVELFLDGALDRTSPTEDPC